MGNYIQDPFLLPNRLDDIGLDLGLNRLDDEPLDMYRKRLLLEARDPSGSSEQHFLRTLNRRVGKFDTPVFEIDLLLDGSGQPLAADPYIEITSSRLRAYSDKSNGILEFELDIVSRSRAYFLREVQSAFDTSSFFSISILNVDYSFKRSDHLMVGNTVEYVPSELLYSSFENDLRHKYISDFRATSKSVFQNEVASASAVVDDGDFFIDYTNGVVFTHLLGSSTCTYSYRNFPYTLYYQEVRAFPLNDPDTKFRYRDTILSDDSGLPVYKILNSSGARVTNFVQMMHPLGWGQ